MFPYATKMQGFTHTLENDTSAFMPGNKAIKRLNISLQNRLDQGIFIGVFRESLRDILGREDVIFVKKIFLVAPNRVILLWGLSE